MPTVRPALEAFVAQSIGRAAPPEIAIMAASLHERLGSGVAAIIAYGSCLRGVATSESLIDLYVLTHSATAMPIPKLAQWACGVVPPNVYYAECSYEGTVLRSKYAMLPIDQFAHWMRSDTSNPYFWARFAQPSALVYCADDTTRAKVTMAIGA